MRPAEDFEPFVPSSKEKPSNDKFDPTKWCGRDEEGYGCLTDEAMDEVDEIIEQWEKDGDDEKMFDALATYRSPYNVTDMYVRDRVCIADTYKAYKKKGRKSNLVFVKIDNK
ncbi:MAG: hypothetical protein PHV24_06300 [Candidatus Kapabacteria bacterium]|nr:hypothetical protein [Candidatus Kapabacteria bacterium]